MGQIKKPTGCNEESPVVMAPSQSGDRADGVVQIHDVAQMAVRTRIEFDDVHVVGLLSGAIRVGHVEQMAADGQYLALVAPLHLNAEQFGVDLDRKRIVVRPHQ